MGKRVSIFLVAAFFVISSCFVAYAADIRIGVAAPFTGNLAAYGDNRIQYSYIVAKGSINKNKSNKV